ncbi:MAG: serine/threonine protein kinase, partial [Labilithrix sp.]|nr:serine/threonine protein kinase [Labilithrix sp.]
MQNHAVDPFGIVGQVLDAQFRVDRLVGEGGFSAVYRGHHLGLDEPIAIKCLKLPPALSPPLVEQFAKRFRDESRILYRLSQGNLNVVRSIAAGTWQAPTGLLVPFMILEWMEGRSLASEFAIRRSNGQTGRPLEEVVKLFGSAADGLGHAHSQGVVHRDLNPGNLFLASTPHGTRMKVLDFGVAKILDDSTLDIARTQTVGQIRIFAPAYGAPEQFDDGIGAVGAASDVYAFALILLEALRDRSVNDGQHLGEFAQKAVDPGRRPTPRMLGVDVTDEVEQIFARATKLDPRERWQSAGELWQALAIAASAASQQKHAQAAKETPPLAMPAPPGARSTQAGMAPPPHLAGKAPGGARMDRTMPLGAVLPKVDAP